MLQKTGLWSIKDVVALIGARAEAPKPRGLYMTNAKLAAVAENSN